MFGETSFSEKMFTYWLNCLKKVEIVFNIGPKGPSSSKMVDSFKHSFWLTEELQKRTFLNNWKFLWVQHTMITLPLLRSVIVKFPVLTPVHEVSDWKQLLQTPCCLDQAFSDFHLFGLLKNFYMEQSFPAMIK